MRFLCGLILVTTLHAQRIITNPQTGGRPILMNGDTAVLESGEPRRDLDCQVIPEKPALGFDLKFHSGYSLTIPLRELEGPGDMLSVLFRIAPKNTDGAPVYFGQQIRVPAISDTKGAVSLTGAFDLGEGSYHVDWLVHDYTGRYCSAYWDTTAALSPRDSEVAVALPPASIRAAEDEKFQPEPPVQRTMKAPLNIKLMLNFAPEQADSAAVDPEETTALVSILRNISRNPEIGRFSLVAFNIQEQRVIYRQESSDHIDFPAMGEALRSLNLGTVAFSKLQHKNGDTEFLSNLVKTEIGNSHPDGLIFIGPKAFLDSSVPQEDLKQVGDLGYPVFYMNYARDPYAAPWRDAISRMVRFFKGRVYTISGPRDLWNAVSEVISRIATSHQVRETGER